MTSPIEVGGRDDVELVREEDEEEEDGRESTEADEDDDEEEGEERLPGRGRTKRMTTRTSMASTPRRQPTKKARTKPTGPILPSSLPPFFSFNLFFFIVIIFIFLFS